MALTAFALGMAITLQFSGRLSDKYGRRPMILAGLLVCCVFTAVLGLATSFWPLLILCACAGVGSGLMAPSTQAALADIIGNDRSAGKVLSTFQMTQDAGQILAPIIVGWVAQVAGFSAAFGLCGVICFIALVLFFLFGAETKNTTRAGVSA